MTEIARLFAYVGADTTEFERKMAGVSRQVRETSGSLAQQFDGLSRVLTGGMTALLGMAGLGGVALLGERVAAVTREWYEQGLALQAAERTYRALSGDGLEGIEALRRATSGLVSNTEALRAANQYMAMGLAQNTEEAGQLLSVATRLALLMGRDVNGAIAEFAQLLANQSMRRLDQFGISAAQVEQRVEALKAQFKGMSDEAAFTRAVMEQAEETLARAGDVTDTSAAKVQGLRSAWQNLRAELGARIDASIVMQVVTEAVEGAGTALQVRRSAKALYEEYQSEYQRMALEITGLGLTARPGEAYTAYDELLMRIQGRLLEIQRLQVEGAFNERQAAEAYRRAIEELQHAYDAYRPAFTGPEIAEDIQQLRAIPQTLQEIADAAKDAAGNVDELGISLDKMGRFRLEYAAREMSPAEQAAYWARILGNFKPWSEEWVDIYSRYYLPAMEEARKPPEAGPSAYPGMVPDREALARQKALYSEQAQALRQYTQQIRSLVEDAMRPTSVTQEDLLSTMLGVYQNKPDEYLRRLRAAVYDAKSEWRYLIAGMSQEQAELYLMQQERAYATGRWSQLGPGFDREQAIQAIIAQVREAYAAQREREALINEIMARPELQGLGLGREQLREVLGLSTDYEQMAAENMRSFAAGAATVDVGQEVSRAFKDQIAAQAEMWKSAGGMAITYFTDGMREGISATVGSQMISAIWPFLAPLVDQMVMGGRP